MYYKDELDSCKKGSAFAAGRLHALREQLYEDIPQKEDGKLLLASWNIRKFSSQGRLHESLLYIAEIIDHFDLVAIQEVGRSLTNLNTICGILGSWWDYVVSDATEGDPGNDERLAFLYDKRRVRFGGVAGEVVIPPKPYKEEGKNKFYKPAEQLYRTPYLVGFKSSWRKFMLCTVHIVYGDSSANNPTRLKEIELVAEFLRDRASDKTAYSEAIALIGDFNIFKPSDNTMTAITDAGFEVPPELQKIPGSNVEQNRHYDQIAFMGVKRKLGFTRKAGVFNYYSSVFRDTDIKHYASAQFKSYKDWRTFQMSDHLPMWIQLQTDFADEYLDLRTKG